MRTSTAVPKAMQVQLERLFGSNAREAKAKARTPAEWKRTLNKVLDELERYLDANVHTDELHFFLLMTCIMAGRESLKEEDFLAGYAEAVTRLALLLMGDYPDHRRRRTGLKKADHYSLNRHRSVVFSRDQNQKLANLIAASRIGFPARMPDPFAALREFRSLRGQQATYRHFLLWFRRKYPEAYAGVF